LVLEVSAEGVGANPRKLGVAPAYVLARRVLGKILVGRLVVPLLASLVLEGFGTVLNTTRHRAAPRLAAGLFSAQEPSNVSGF